MSAILKHLVNKNDSHVGDYVNVDFDLKDDDFLFKYNIPKEDCSKLVNYHILMDFKSRNFPKGNQDYLPINLMYIPNFNNLTKYIEDPSKWLRHFDCNFSFLISQYYVLTNK